MGRPKGTIVRNLIGQKFYMLLVLEFAGYRHNRAQWLCLCDCGNKKIIVGDQMTSKHNPTKSCGCLLSGCAPYLEGDEAAFRTVYRCMIRCAKDRNIFFDLTPEQVRKISSQDCFYCGGPPSNTQKEKPRREGSSTVSYIYNGVDRFNNDIGYVFENCVPCCWICNYMKRDKTVEQFLEHIDKIKNKIGKISR